MGRDGLGDLEHQTMLALLRLRQDSYTAPIVEELQLRTGRRTSVAAVYVVLRRLEKKRLVRSELQDPGEDGGRDRRCFEVTPAGLDKLRRAQQAYRSLWRGLNLADGDAR